VWRLGGGGGVLIEGWEVGVVTGRGIEVLGN
jgi:hypothetical protein